MSPHFALSREELGWELVGRQAGTWWAGVGRTLLAHRSRRGWAGSSAPSLLPPSSVPGEEHRKDGEGPRSAKLVQEPGLTPALPLAGLAEMGWARLGSRGCQHLGRAEWMTKLIYSSKEASDSTALKVR